MFASTVSKTLTSVIVTLKMTEHCVPNDYDRCMFCGEDMSDVYY